MDGDLPTAKQQKWLISQTAALLARGGQERYLEGPILEPSPRYFPDPWSPDIDSATAVTRRLLDYAGLGDLGIELSPFVEHPRDEEEDAPHSVAGWFAGIDGRLCRFGIHLGQLRDPEGLAGVMAHEVAHAYRHAHQLCEPDHALEERLTDLTTVYLGAGVLLTNLTYRRRIERNAWQISLWRSSGGYLSTEEMSFLLALQAVARGLGAEEARRLGRLLDSDQAGCFREALDLLAPDRPKLLRRLGLSPQRPVTAPAARAQALVAAPGEARLWGRHWGRVVYRIRYTQVLRGTIAGFLGGTSLLILLRVLGVHPSVGLSLWPLCLAVGFVFGSLSHVERCSNTSCGAALPARATECPRCVGQVLGELDEPPASFAEASNLGRRIFRVRGTRAHLVAPKIMMATWLVLMLQPFSLGSAPSLTLITLAGLAGAAVGHRQRRDRCSDPDCETILPSFLRECPRCLGEIHGEIKYKNERLKAEEECEKAEAARRRSDPRLTERPAA